jgi:hydrogenase 3 maturation protease
MTFSQRLRERLKGNVVVIGVGNSLCGDDAVGCSVANQLKETRHLRVIVADETPESYFGLVATLKPDTVVFIDAVDLGKDPGNIALIEKDQFLYYLPSTHRMPLGILMSLIGHETGADVFLLGVQPKNTSFGGEVSPEVALSSELLANAIEEVSLPDRESLL